MNPIDVINDFYFNDDEQRRILLSHSRSVAEKALRIADKHPELNLDRDFLYEGAMLHDLGIFLTHAPAIQCYGPFPYISHGYLGADLLRSEGYFRHALVCERHTGAGISLEQIEEEQLPLPRRDLVPVTLEEQVICFADKFFSKTSLGKEKSVAKARRSLEKYGDAGLERFDRWCLLFL